MEIRYVDDYYSLRKGLYDIPPDRVKAIKDILRDGAFQRYPLLLERDEGQRLIFEMLPYGHLRHPPFANVAVSLR